MKKLTTLLFIFVFTGSMTFAQNNEAEVEQMSDYNEAEITQDGEDNYGYIKQSSYAEYNDHSQVQDGESNEATASVYADNIEGTQVQWGEGNVSALNQAASNSSAETYQGGYDQTARVHQSGGSGNSATVYQALGGNGEAETLEGEFFFFGEDNTVGIKQDGSGNDVITAQFGVGNSAGSDWWGNLGIHQKGTGNDAMLGQFGYGNSASITQDGSYNQTTIMQNGSGGAIGQPASVAH
jgi:hypothetical protein